MVNPDTVFKIGVVSDQMYVEFLDTKAGQNGYRRFFELILDSSSDKAVLWHCTSGKDRTGVAAMLLLSVLGASEDLIVHDYLLTNQFNKDAISKQRQVLVLEGADPTLLNDMLTVRYAVNESYLRNAIGYLKSTYGSVSTYVTEVLGLSKDALLELRDRYLE